jgi:TolB-like protein
MSGLRLKIAVCLLVLLGLAIVAACTRTVDRTESAAGGLYRQRWWNYYERALGAIDAGDYAAAGGDLVRALQQRDRDQRMARTYGMHFVDYFPHRELGMVYWLQGDLKSAEIELNRSIAQESSAKARFYLDQVRKALIRQRGDVGAPPRLELALPRDPLWTTDQRLTVEGRAVDPDYVSAIHVNGEKLYLDGARSDFAFAHELFLPQGCHPLVVEAANLAGRTTRRQALVCVDSLGPQVVLESIVPLGAGLLLSGEVMDGAGVAELRIAGRSLPADGAVEVAFEIYLDDPAAGTQIQCRDRLGNLSEFLFHPNNLPSAGAPERRVASLHLAGLFAARDEHPPALRLQHWQAHQTVYLEKVVLTGSAHDAGGVTALSVNGESILPRSGPMVFFTHILDLQPGINTIVLKACDAAGNCRERVLSIERKVPKGLMLEERLCLAVFPFDHKGRITEAGLVFQDDFIHALVQRRRFRLVERQRLDLVLEEQKINRSRLIDPNTALRLGHLAAAQAIVAGTLVETRTGMEIIGRVIDSETGEILCTADTYGEDKTLAGLKEQTGSLALKLHREFPLVDGVVIERKGDLIITDLTLDMLRAQRRILIYAEHPVSRAGTGQAMGMDHEVLGTARVTQADAHLSKARLHPDTRPAIAPRHLVITQ